MTFASMNGRIQLKDLRGQSYMALRFYKRFPLESEHMRIIDLVKTSNSNIRDKVSKKRIKDNHHFANFEFKTRAEQENIELVSGEINQAGAGLSNFDTDLSGLNVVTDNSMIGLDGN